MAERWRPWWPRDRTFRRRTRGSSRPATRRKCVTVGGVRALHGTHTRTARESSDAETAPPPAACPHMARKTRHQPSRPPSGVWKYLEVPGAHLPQVADVHEGEELLLRRDGERHVWTQSLHPALVVELGIECPAAGKGDRAQAVLRDLPLRIVGHAEDQPSARVRLPQASLEGENPPDLDVGVSFGPVKLVEPGRGEAEGPASRLKIPLRPSARRVRTRDRRAPVRFEGDILPSPRGPSPRETARAVQHRGASPYSTFRSFGAFQVPSLAASWGQYRRMYMAKGPFGAGSQLGSMALPGDSLWM